MNEAIFFGQAEPKIIILCGSKSLIEAATFRKGHLGNKESASVQDILDRNPITEVLWRDTLQPDGIALSGSVEKTE